jgi:hypothetical protein
MTSLQTFHGVPVLTCGPDGGIIYGERDVMDYVGDAAYQGAEWVAVPAERFDEAFFELRTRVAGDIVQKFAKYGLGLAVLGDVSRYTQVSTSFRDFVRECNRGRQTWFLTDLDALRERLTG